MVEYGSTGLNFILFFPIHSSLPRIMYLKESEILTKVRFTTKQRMFGAEQFLESWKFCTLPVAPIGTFIMSEIIMYRVQNDQNRTAHLTSSCLIETIQQRKNFLVCRGQSHLVKCKVLLFFLPKTHKHCLEF